MFSAKNSFASIAIVVASMLWAQSFCSEMFFPQPAAEPSVSSAEVMCNYDDAACFPTWVGIEQSTTEEGFPILGSPDAPIIIAEFGDFGCPHCLDFVPTVQDITDDYVREGQAQLQYVPLTFVAGDRSELAAKAGLCATQQDAFWQLHEVLFNIQEVESAAGFTVDNVVTHAEEIGLDGVALTECIDSAFPDQTLRAATTFQNDLGIRGTPSIAYSTDGGETWTYLENRDPSNIIATIIAANSE